LRLESDLATSKQTASRSLDRQGLAIRRVPLASIHNDPANARAHDEANLGAITASLQRFGQAEPLVVHKPTGRVIGGNYPEKGERDIAGRTSGGVSEHLASTVTHGGRGERA